jgi:hypothetical protein
MARISISHWLPIITFCPVNRLPDFVYVTVTFENHFEELYAIRKRIRKTISGQKAFMEDLTYKLSLEFPEAVEIELALVTRRHVVTIRRCGG